jgi:hypothetical protein
MAMYWRNCQSICGAKLAETLFGND